jgi:hypothetical protein
MQHILCELGVLCGLGEKSSLNGRVSNYTSQGSHQAHNEHQAHKGRKETRIICETLPIYPLAILITSLAHSSKIRLKNC